MQLNGVSLTLIILKVKRFEILLFWYNSKAVGPRTIRFGMHHSTTVRVWKYDPITATIRDQLHWLPVRLRIEYELWTIVYRWLYNAAPSYRAELCISMDSNLNRRHLRSAAHGEPTVPRTRTNRYEPCSFTVSVPVLWNSQHVSLRDVSLLFPMFRSRLKTVLFFKAYNALSWHMRDRLCAISVHVIEIFCTYLSTVRTEWGCFRNCFSLI